MNTPRLTHIVDTDHYDLDMAMALGLEIVAQCGLRFTPKVSGDDTAPYPECVTCHPQKKARSSSRGQHRTSTEERSQFPHYVYRCFDRQGRLLYVGCTYSPPARMRQHRAEKGPWIGKVEATRLTVWPNRRKALDMERLAIETERPIYNKAFNRESA